SCLTLRRAGRGADGWVSSGASGPATRAQQMGLAWQGTTAGFAGVPSRHAAGEPAQSQGRYTEMKRNLRGFAAAGSLFVAMFAAEAACAQKQGGILKMYSPDSPASVSIHEEASVFAGGPMMGVFNSLVMFDQHVPQNSL